MNPTRKPESSPSARRPEDARVAAELAALGELEPGPELDASESMLEHGPADDPEVALVISLFGLAHGATPELSPLERRRVWRRLETMQQSTAHPPEVRKIGGGWWIGLAAAAALVLVPLFAPEQMKRTSDPDTRATLVAMGQQARRSLGEMPGGQDETRARALADDYAARLHATRPTRPTRPTRDDAPNGGER
jgi:hypothetical protein